MNVNMVVLYTCMRPPPKRKLFISLIFIRKCKVYKCVPGQINRSGPLFQHQSPHHKGRWSASWEEREKKSGADLEVAGSTFSSPSRKFGSALTHTKNSGQLLDHKQTHAYLGCSTNPNKQFVTANQFPSCWLNPAPYLTGFSWVLI